MDLSQFAVDSLVVVAVFILMNLIGKPLVEVWLKPDNANHDVVVRATAVVLGVIGIYLDHGFPLTTDGHAWLLLTVSGILSGASAIGVYHVTQSGPASTPPAPPTATDIATALTAALEPVVARLAPSLTAVFTPSPLHQAAGIAGQVIAVEPLPPDATPKPETLIP